MDTKDSYMEEAMAIVLAQMGIEPSTPYIIEPIKANLWISTVYRVTIAGKGVSLFVKRLPDDKERRLFFDAPGFFEHEVVVYNHILKEFQDFQKEKGIVKPVIFGPRCVYAKCDGINDIVILEDLTSEGYHVANKMSGLQVETLRILMDMLGRFHALSLAMKSQQPNRFKQLRSAPREICWAPPHYDRSSGVLFTKFGKLVYDMALKELGADNKYVHHLARIGLETGKILKSMANSDPGNEPWNVMTHGDLWPSNLMVNADRRSLRFVDFQQVRYTSPVLDVSSVLYLCMDGPTRKEYGDELLHLYHSKLSEFLVELGSNPNELFPFSELENQLKRYGRFGLGIGFLNIPHAMNAPEDADLDAEEGLAVDAVVKECGDFSPECKKRLLDCVMHAVDTGIL